MHSCEPEFKMPHEEMPGEAFRIKLWRPFLTALLMVRQLMDQEKGCQVGSEEEYRWPKVEDVEGNPVLTIKRVVVKAFLSGRWRYDNGLIPSLCCGLPWIRLNGFTTSVTCACHPHIVVIYLQNKSVCNYWELAQKVVNGNPARERRSNRFSIQTGCTRTRSRNSLI